MKRLKLAINTPKVAVGKLNKMISIETKHSDLAKIHFEIFKISNSCEYKERALKLYEKMPYIKYKNRIDELMQV